MAKKIKRKKSKAQPLPFDSTSYILFGSGVLAIFIGFILMLKENITLAPILMVLGYCVIIPIAIFRKRKEKDIAEPRN